jgi:phage recombination protein Bet
MSNKSNSLVVRMADRFGVDAEKLMNTLKATAFRQRDGSAPTNEQMMALLVVSEQYNLNPFTKEIYAFPDSQNNGIIPVVGVDGWSRIINSHQNFDGVEFEFSEAKVKMEGALVECHEWIECIIYRNDRSRPTRIREYLDEVYRPPFKGQGQNGPYTKNGPWQTHTKRQLRHKAFIQCSRIALGFTGIYDHDEAERIREMDQGVVITQANTDLALTSAGQASQPLQIDHQKMDPILQKLANRAVKQNAWSAVQQYAEERFSGAELEYATQYLRDRELDAMDPPAPNYGEQDGSSADSASLAEGSTLETACAGSPESDEDFYFAGEEPVEQ